MAHGGNRGTRIAHVGIAVQALDATLPFYRDVLGLIGKFVARRGPGIHHICFAVDDLNATLERCRRAGVRLIDETPRMGAEGKRIAFLHPSSTGGVLVELTEH
jgi:methylmalonyl-CoA/ethylmalonyl-CoA epimerase